MTPSLDIHVLVHPRTPKAWVGKCLATVQEAQRRAGMPTALFVLPAVEGHIGRARMAAYRKGNHQYVTSVDDDDWVDPDAFSVLREAMAARPAGITTRFVIDEPGRPEAVAVARDNLRVFRRDVALSSGLEDWPVYDSWQAMHHADQSGDVVELTHPVYHHRQGHVSHHAKLLEKEGPGMQDRIDALTQFHPMRLKEDRPAA